jgi:hypothetical protein
MDTKPPCNTNYRILPQIYAIEIAKYFEIELHLGKMTSWGIAKFRDGAENGCKHWMMRVAVGDNYAIPAMCFKTKKEAADYCEHVGNHFAGACQALFGDSYTALKVNPN